MDIWFWIIVAFIVAVALYGAVRVVQEDGWHQVLGLFGIELTPVFLLGDLGALALLLIAVFGGNDGLLLVVGVPLAIGVIGLIAWRFRH